MPFIVTCPSCSAKLRAPDHLAGHVVRCPKCGQEVAIPVDSSGMLAYEVVETREETPKRVKTRKKDLYGSQRKLSIGQCFSDAIEVYKYNFPTLILSYIVAGILTLISFGILGFALIGGLFLMAMNGLLRRDHRVDFSDLFGAFDKFFPLIGLIIIQAIIIILGFCCCVFPGILLIILFLYSIPLMVDLDLGIFESLNMSKNIVSRQFTENLFLSIAIILTYIPVQIIMSVCYFIIYIVCLLLNIAEIAIIVIELLNLIIIMIIIPPFHILLITSAYLQQRPKRRHED